MIEIQFNGYIMKTSEVEPEEWIGAAISLAQGPVLREFGASPRIVEIHNHPYPQVNISVL